MSQASGALKAKGGMSDGSVGDAEPADGRVLSKEVPMGGGHVMTPDFRMPQPDAAYPLTEFYPAGAAGAGKKRQLYAARPLRRAASPCPAHLPGGGRRVFTACGCSGRGPDPAALPCPDAPFLYSSLQVQPDGTPAALLLTEECTRLTVAVQLPPPFVWEDPLPPLPIAPGGAHPAIDHAGRDGHRDHFPAALAQKLVISNLCRRTWTCLAVRCVRYTKMEGTGFCSAIIGDAEPYIK